MGHNNEDGYEVMAFVFTFILPKIIKLTKKNEHIASLSKSRAGKQAQNEQGTQHHAASTASS